jgi:hypothetical protein
MDPSVPDTPQGPLSESGGSATTLHVCVTCLAGEDRETAPRAGRRLHDALVDAQRRQDAPPSFRIVENQKHAMWRRISGHVPAHAAIRRRFPNVAAHDYHHPTPCG